MLGRSSPNTMGCASSDHRDGRLQSWVAPSELTPINPTRIAGSPLTVWPPPPPAWPPPPQPPDLSEGSGPRTGPVEAVAPVDYGWPSVLVGPGREGFDATASVAAKVHNRKVDCSDPPASSGPFIGSPTLEFRPLLVSAI